VAVAVAVAPASPAHSRPRNAAVKAARKELRAVKRELLGFERELDALVKTFGSLQRELEAIEDFARIRRRLRALAPQAAMVQFANSLLGIRLEPRGLASLSDTEPRGGAPRYLRKVRELSQDLAFMQRAPIELQTAGPRKEVIEAMLPRLRRLIWQKGSDRQDLIDELDVAIRNLQAARGEGPPTNAGFDGGFLITYSADWEAVSQCESGGDWHINTGNGYDGGLQFHPNTWIMFGGGEYMRYAYQASRRQQIDIAERVLAVQGPRAWPNCFRALPADS
jgi:hypothetical protein